MIIKSILDTAVNDIKSFNCGNKDLDDFLKKYALRNDQNGYGKTFLMFDNENLVGFFTISSSSIKYEEFPVNESLPRYPIPSIRIARLAVSKNFQGKGYGKALLTQAFIKILSVSDTIGIRLVVVDAKESSASFYEKYGFKRLLGNKLSYYLLVDTLKKAIK